MKKTLSIVAIVSSAILSFSSCSKCTDCSKSGGSLVRVCRDSYNSNTAYNAQVTYYENTGYNCN